MVVLAAGEVMGQQRYEQEVREAMVALPRGLSVRTVRVASLRSRLPHERRLALTLSTRGGALSAACAGFAYRGIDVVHRCDLRLPPGGRRPEVLTIHDFAFLRYGDEGRVSPFSLESVSAAKIVLSPSSYIADEVRQRTGHPDVRVAHNGVSPGLSSVAHLSERDRAELGVLGARYVFHGGGASRRKNLAGLAAAWQQVSAHDADVHLVLAGPIDSRRTRLFAELPRTHLVGQLPRELLLRAMAGAAVVVVPSEYEGFGLPALEAMALGVPVVASACASLPEIVGAAGLLVTPTGEGLAGGVLEVLAQDPQDVLPNRVARERAAQFTWEASAAVHLQAYADAVSTS